MKTYPSADLTQRRSDVLSDAGKAPVLIQYMTTRRVVVAEYVIMTKEKYDELINEQGDNMSDKPKHKTTRPHPKGDHPKGEHSKRR